MGKGGSERKQLVIVMGEDASVNIDATCWPTSSEAAGVVRRIQDKLHCWALSESERRFDDLFNLVHDRRVLVVAFERVASNKGSRAPGVDARTVSWIVSEVGVGAFLQDIRDQLKARTFSPMPTRRVMED